VKYLSGFILVVFILLSIGCNQYVAIDNYTTFPVPFGHIAKGDSMKEVMQKLGKPIDISHNKRKEVWRYNFAQIGEVFVYFEKGDVVDMQFSNRPKKGCSNCAGYN